MPFARRQHKGTITEQLCGTNKTKLSALPRRGPLPALVVLVTTGVLLLGPTSTTSAQEVYRDGDKSLKVGLWTQCWYQYVQAAADRDEDGDPDDLHDFLLRRMYLSVSGTATSWLGFFVHIAADRIGQGGLDKAGVGLGSGIAVRDGWVSVRLLGGALNLFGGRMYVPFTRNYGTTSTKALLTTDLDWVQGGYRGSIFYPSTVGRDDGVTLWGNIAGGLLQYRLMVADGMDDPARNPDDLPRLAGRLSLSLFQPETEWFNQGSYLGARKVLSIGGGVDYQRLTFGEESVDQDYFSWTGDLHYDQPLAGGSGLTLNGSYIGIFNAANPIPFSVLGAGADADVAAFKAGFLLPGNLGPGRAQPFAHYELIYAREPGEMTHVSGFGFNYFFAGHANKLSAEATWVAQGGDSNPALRDHLIVTVQLAGGL